MNEASNTTKLKFMASSLFDDEPVQESHHEREGCGAGVEHGESEAALCMEVCSSWNGEKSLTSGNKATALEVPIAWPEEMLERPKLEVDSYA